MNLEKEHVQLSKQFEAAVCAENDRKAQAIYNRMFNIENAILRQKGFEPIPDSNIYQRYSRDVEQILVKHNLY